MLGQTTRSQVVFSRSADSPAPPPRSAQETAPAALADSVTDAMRTAPTFRTYDFTIHLQPATAAIQVQLRATLRNDGTTPLVTLPLQLSSSLHFEHIRLGEKPLRFAVHSLSSDADHTGALAEAAIELPAPLAPGAQISLTIDYSGTIEPSSVRLDRIGTPATLAAESDWDRIADNFVGLRGFGDTVWYPVASVPAVLGDGAVLFHEIGRQKQRNSDASVQMDVTIEFKGEAPNVSLLDGQTVAATAPVAMPSADFPGVQHLHFGPALLGFNVPSLVLATRQNAGSTASIQVEAQPDHADAAPNYLAASNLLDPLYQGWLNKPASALVLVDLPIEGGAAAEDGDALLVSLNQGTPADLADSLAVPLTHPRFHSPRAWLQEGVPGFMSVLWTERTSGLDKALQQLGSTRAALAIAEPSSPGTSAGQPLIAAQDPVFYRAKATSVLWMLRVLAGDNAMAAALRAYDPAMDTTPDYFEHVLQKEVNARVVPSGQTVDTGTPNDADNHDLHWFFQNWVYDDPGLPDLAISNVFSSKTGAGDQWLVAVELSNTGYTEAEVPLTVRSANTSTTVQVRIPARGNLSRRILLNGAPSEVDLNDGSVPEVEASVHKRVIQ